MTEDKFEEFLQKAAQSYNVPPARTPRDEMWSAIQAQRASGPRVVYGGGLPARESSVRRFGSKVWLGAAAAAALFLVTGVGIGRWSASRNAPTSIAAVNPKQTGSSTAAPDAPSTSAETGVDAGAASPNQTASSRREASSSGASGRNGADRRDLNGGSGSRVALGAAPGNSAPGSAYQLTAVRHLSEAEALLTSFRARSTSDQQMDAQLGAWARDLLSNTRLLLDSPVANDPQRRPLLEDLELVLVQIVQLSPG
ncbi:MAG: hypothetical protein ABI994_11245, partial [Gemmatimonadales bacterium]